jgi:sulfopyruvate decarboxylase subunit alpha
VLHHACLWFFQVPISLDNSRVIHEALKKCGIHLVLAMPETWLVPMVRMIEDDCEMTLLPWVACTAST